MFFSQIFFENVCIKYSNSKGQQQSYISFLLTFSLEFIILEIPSSCGRIQEMFHSEDQNFISTQLHPIFQKSKESLKNDWAIREYSNTTITGGRSGRIIKPEK